MVIEKTIMATHTYTNIKNIHTHPYSYACIHIHNTYTQHILILNTKITQITHTKPIHTDTTYILTYIHIHITH